MFAHVKKREKSAMSAFGQKRVSFPRIGMSALLFRVRGLVPPPPVPGMSPSYLQEIDRVYC